MVTTYCAFQCAADSISTLLGVLANALNSPPEEMLQMHHDTFEVNACAVRWFRHKYWLLTVEDIITRPDKFELAAVQGRD